MSAIQMPARPEPPPLTPMEERRAYRDMLLIRRFEEKAGQLYGMGHIGGFCHLSIGQEAVVTGLQMAARDGDQVIATYRAHAQMLACGMEPKIIMAELTGRRGGVSKGKGGSMHMFSRTRQFFGGHGIVGASVPIGAGLALASKHRGTGAVCWCYFGDGAADQGQVYETFNMAERWSLPIVLVIENNTFAAEPSPEPSVDTSLAARGRPFAIPSEQIDGMDVRAVKAAGVRAAGHARAGNGPYILEMQTYRYRGHSMSDPGKYGGREEARRAREQRDPIERVRARLLETAAASEDDLRRMDREVRDIVNAATDFALIEPEPDARELASDVCL